ncbi:hypothetical protein [Kineosporia sp. R_H_3]|uniref:hypothetical protein n=1 Tax=Kineosporia sp. R_H_3 TaxID=1961848 RepID=UPI000B4A98C5|nr:hypothetical protein [Kineosporia sp. R_H_3]
MGVRLSELRAWPEHDYSTAVALTLYEDGLCHGCGHPLAETTSLDADPNAQDRTHHYVAPIPTRCHACTAIGLLTPEYDEAPQSDALRFRAERIDDPRDDEHEHTEQAGGTAAP